MIKFYPKPYEPFSGDINVTFDLSNYATKTDVKNISHVDTSSFALKTNLATLKTEVAEVNNIDTSDFALKSKYDTDKTELENKVPNVTDFVKEAKPTEL